MKLLTSHELKALSNEIQIGLGMMKSLEAQHPKAKITFDLENKRVSITYSLPKDHVSIERFIMRDVTPITNEDNLK